MKYRINDIVNFVETTTCNTIVESARRLEISQPALSESLKRLEADLNYTLFYRSRTGIRLTPSGHVFLDKAKVFLSAFNALDVSTQSDDLFYGQTVTIGCHSTVAQYSLPKALSYLKKAAPNFKINLKHDLSRHIQMDIQKGNTDIGIIINPSPVPDLVIQKLAVDTVGLWTLKTNTTWPTETIICNLNLFQTQSILKKWKIKSDKVIATDSLELITQLVHENIGVGILPERAVRLSKANLKLIPSAPTYKDEICLVYRPEFGKNEAEKMVIEALRKSIKESTNGLTQE